MAIGILSHTFPMTHNLSLFRRVGDRYHFLTDDGRDILAKPTDNPAYTTGLCYWESTYTPDVDLWMSGRIG